MSRTNRFTVVLAVVLGLACSATAAEVEIHGFLSQGFIVSSGNNFLSARSTDGSFELNEAGLNFGTSVSPRLRIGAQLYMRDMGDLGQNRVLLDWALAEYSVSDSFGIRIGRIKMPGGLYHQIQDFDSLRSYAILPPSVYYPTWREFFNTYNGLGIYGELPLGSAGRLEYQAGLGNVSFEPQLGDMALISQGLGLPPASLMKTDYTAVLGLDYYPAGSLRFVLGAVFAKGYWADAGLTVDAGQQVGPYRLGDLIALDARVYRYAWDQDVLLLTAGSQYEVGPLTLDLEYRLQARDNHRDWEALDGGDNTRDGGYAGASIRIGDHWRIGGYYARQWERRDDRDGEKLAAGTLSPRVALSALQGNPSPDYAAWRRQIAFGLNYIANEHWVFKLEGHLARGTQELSPFNWDTPASEQDEDWSFLVVKGSFTF